MNQIKSMCIFWCSPYTNVDAVLLVLVHGMAHLGKEERKQNKLYYVPGGARDCAEHFAYVISLNALRKKHSILLFNTLQYGN